ncbi:MAG: putative DNA binding domain-containing protein [Ardenticatenaceae bacterium]|nr:putative DNA binding domain-containing protein [Ardenticatenaceae bacterium]
MSQFNITRSRQWLQEFKFADLFRDELGWNNPSFHQPLNLTVNDMAYTCQPIAELSGMVVFEVTAADGQIPYSQKRKAVYQAIAQNYHENLLIFIDESRAHSIWYWVKRDGGKSYPRTHHYDRWQDPDFHLGKISGLFVAMSELDPTGRIEITKVVQRVQGALDIERVTKRFYGEFQQVHDTFMAYLEPSIPDEKDRRWYTSALLNRLMFIYFLQRQRLIDKGATGYLHDKLQERDWQDGYYRAFLHPLFFEGFALPESKRSAQAKAVLGTIPYLNGGLFLHHPIELKYKGQIQIPDQAFTELFSLLDGYTWHLDDRPGKDNREINPDVLGYIFEKYINQKAFGAYYTRPEITEYLCEQTIERLVLEKMREVDEHDLGILPPLDYEDVHELLRKMDGRRALILLQDILPKLSLLDPACGSGAFLVAALKTLTAIYQSALGRADYLDFAALRQYLDKELHGHPNRNYYIRKKIISHNLFGVDIMDEAVEIARLRLFLALVATIRRPQDLEPLPNIDFNILPGNSLIGLLRVDEETFNQMTPAEAGGALEQKGMFPAMKQGSLLGLMGQHSYRQMVEEKERLVQSYRLASTLTDDVEKLRADIEEHRRRAQSTLNQILLDEFGELGIKYEQATWDSQKNKEGKAKKRALKLADIAALQPFHWGYEFDEVMNTRGGFDAIITNPPWEIWKPQAKEFFADYAEVVTKNKMRIEEFQKEQQGLLQNQEIRAAWLDYLSRFPHQSAYFRTAGQYKNQTAVVGGRKTGSDLNLYKLFTEQCNNLLRNGGLCGTVIPSGIYTDLGATGLRYMLFEQTELMGIFGFENRRAIFEGVDSRFKFVVLTFRKGGKTETFPATFMQHDVAELDNFPGNTLEMSLSLVRRLSPEPLSLMEFTHPLDVQIAKKMLAFPLLGEEVEGAWQLSFTREFDMTNHSYVFRTEPCDTCLPLYEGKMIHQFDHNFSEPRYWVEEREGRAAVLGRREDVEQPLDYQTYRLAFRDVARNTDMRTVICTVIPTAFHGNTVPTVKIFDADDNRLIDNAKQLFVCGIWNSFAMDWQARQKVTYHLNYFYLNQLAMPRFTEQDPTFQAIVSRVAQLICTTPEFDDLAAAVGLGSHAHGVTDPTQRAQLRAELDGLIAHVYGLTEAEFSHILSTFPLVADEVKEAALHEYRQLAPNPELLTLIGGGESESIEFKQAACRNPYTGKQDNSMRDNISKAVAAFMNSSGGTLLIGIADDGIITGIEDEYALANPSKANWDGYELFLADLLNKSLSVATAFHYFTITRHTLHNHDIAQIQVQPTPAPAYVNNKLYVRAGAQSKELQGGDLVGYVGSHWG